MKYDAIDVVIIRVLAMSGACLLSVEIAVFTGINGGLSFCIGFALGYLSQVLALWLLRKG